MKPGTNALNWFEIPVADIERAVKFYKAIFEIDLQIMDMGPTRMAFFGDGSDGKVSGGLAQSEWHKPSMDGVKVYLNGNPNLQDVLDRVPAAGGSVTMPKTQISPEIGYMGFFIDSEGNSIALHSNH